MQSVQPPHSLTFDITMHDDVLVQEGKALQDLSRVLAPHRFCQWSVLLQLIQYWALSNVHKECCCSNFLLQRWNNKATYIITVLTRIRFLMMMIIIHIYKTSFLTAAHSSLQLSTMLTVTKYTSPQTHWVKQIQPVPRMCTCIHTHTLWCFFSFYTSLWSIKQPNGVVTRICTVESLCSALLFSALGPKPPQDEGEVPEKPYPLHPGSSGLTSLRPHLTCIIAINHTTQFFFNRLSES